MARPATDPAIIDAGLELIDAGHTPSQAAEILLKRGMQVSGRTLRRAYKRREAMCDTVPRQAVVPGPASEPTPASAAPSKRRRRRSKQADADPDVQAFDLSIQDRAGFAAKWIDGVGFILPHLIPAEMPVDISGQAMIERSDLLRLCAQVLRSALPPQRAALVIGLDPVGVDRLLSVGRAQFGAKVLGAAGQAALALYGHREAIKLLVRVGQLRKALSGSPSAYQAVESELETDPFQMPARAAEQSGSVDDIVRRVHAARRAEKEAQRKAAAS